MEIGVDPSRHVKREKVTPCVDLHRPKTSFLNPLCNLEIEVTHRQEHDFALLLIKYYFLLT